MVCLAGLMQPLRPWAEISMDFITGFTSVQKPTAVLILTAILVILINISKMAKYIIYL